MLVDDWFKWAECVWEGAHTNITCAVCHFIKQANLCRREAFTSRASDQVWLATQDLCLRLQSKKLFPQYIDPFLVVAQVNPVSYKLKLPPHMCISPLFHVSLLRPVLQGPLENAVANPTLLEALEVEGASAYHVCRLLDSRRRRGHL